MKRTHFTAHPAIALFAGLVGLAALGCSAVKVLACHKGKKTLAVAQAARRT